MFDKILKEHIDEYARTLALSIVKSFFEATNQQERDKIETETLTKYIELENFIKQREFLPNE